jgi:preprotein translocase subunit SecD
VTWNKVSVPVTLALVAGIIAFAAWAISKEPKDANGPPPHTPASARLLLQLHPTAAVPGITPGVLARTKTIVERRLDGMHVTGYSVNAVGTNELAVNVPHATDRAMVERALTQNAMLEYKIVPHDVVQRAESALTQLKNPATPASARAGAQAFVDEGAYAASGPVVYSGADLKGAQSGFDQAGNPDILFQTKEPAKFGKLTSANLGKQLGMFIDHRYVSAPTINGPIYDTGEISGHFTQAEAEALAAQLNTGPLPVPLTVVRSTAAPRPRGSAGATR